MDDNINYILVFDQWICIERRIISNRLGDSASIIKQYRLCPIDSTKKAVDMDFGCETHNI